MARERRKKRTVQDVFDFSKLLLFLATFSASSGYADHAKEYIWSNDKGLIEATECEVSKKPETRFQVVQYSGADDPGYENLRQRNKEVYSRVVNKSLVKFLNGSDVGNFKNIEITGVHEEPGLSIPGHVAQRNYNGYIYKESLRPITEYIFQLTGTPESNDEYYVEVVPGTEFRLLGSFLQPVTQDGEYVIYKCDDKDYIAFDMHVAGHAGVLTRVGVNWDQTKIFRHLRTYTVAEAEAAIEEQERLLAEQQGTPADTSEVQSMQWWHKYIAALNPVTQDAATVDRGDQGEQYDEDELRQAQEAERRALLEEQAEEEERLRQAAEAQAAADRRAQERAQEAAQTQAEPTPVILGELEFRVCVDQGPVAVRGLNEDGSINTEDELMKVRRYALAKPVQGWGESEKTAVIRGQEYTFIQVQFPEVEGENIGWVASPLVKAASSCAGYQSSLGDRQTITCTSSGQLNVYDRNFELLDFRADQFEEIAIRTDVDVEPKFRTVNGQRHEYTAVTFPNRSGAAGWVAKGYIKTKANCEAYQNRSSSSGSSVGAGPLFPTIKRPTMSYVKGGPSVGKKFFGANRSNGRKHAACDLFRPAYERIDSVSDGTLLRGPYEFFSGTFAIEVKSTTGKVLRYGETSSKRPNRTIKKGDFISTIGKNYAGTAMLHFEMYSGAKTGSLSSNQKPYYRRSDLMNPTNGLREWEKARFGRSY